MERKEIIVTFTDGRSAVYTNAILGLLLTDPTVAEIKDRETGAIIYAKQTTHDTRR